MKIGLLSDIHDHKGNLAKAIEILQELKVEEALVLGDLCSPPIMQQLVESGLKYRVIYGNNDGDKPRLMRAAAEGGKRIDMAMDEFAEYEFEGRRVFVTHYPKIAAVAAATGEYRAVFYGHDHRQHWEKMSNGTLLANPGEVWGYRTGVASFAVWDVEENMVEVIEL